MSERPVLVTGATGGLGIALVERLRRAGRAVRATGRSQALRARIEASGAQYISADLTDRATLAPMCAGIGSVIHAAALSSSWGPEHVFKAINVEATRGLLEAASVAGCDRFVFVSSPSIYAEMRDRTGLTEADPPAPRPLNAYARTKLAAERFVLARDDGAMRTTAIRPRAIVGPDDRVLLPRLLEIAQRGRMPLLRRGRALIELTDVRDAAAAILLAEARIEAVAGMAVNVSGGQDYCVRQIADALAGALGRRLRHVPIPMALARWIATLSERRDPRGPEPVLTRYKLATLAYSQTFGPGRAKARLGYRPAHDALATLLAAARGDAA